jgi:hypothetical protein
MSFFVQLTPAAVNALANHHAGKRIAAEHAGDETAFQRHYQRAQELQLKEGQSVALDHDEFSVATAANAAAGVHEPINPSSPRLWSRAPSG